MIRVRLRFLFIVVVAGLIVGQWPVIRGVWDRWNWGVHGKHVPGSVSDSREYFCPMDPGVVSVWPTICPICNMDLVPRNKMDAQLLPEGVVARMQLSPYRIQLAGIRTAVVERRALQTDIVLTGVLKKNLDDSLGFEAAVSEFDSAMFTKALAAKVLTRTSTQPIAATVTLAELSDPPRVRLVLDNSASATAGTIVKAEISIPLAEAEGVLSVPESAVIDRGRERMVYVETMPGMFDGVAVELGRRCGSFYPVMQGLKPGQKVASAGAFLIDAETRLNPSLAAGYFGANRSDSPLPAPVPTASPPVSPQAKKTVSPKKTLSREDQELVGRQKFCPVTELSLDSMGGPVPVTVLGRKVFICCAGCEQRLKNEPEKYLAKLATKSDN